MLLGVWCVDVCGERSLLLLLLLDLVWARIRRRQRGNGRRHGGCWTAPHAPEECKSIDRGAGRPRAPSAGVVAVRPSCGCDWSLIELSVSLK